MRAMKARPRKTPRQRRCASVMMRTTVKSTRMVKRCTGRRRQSLQLRMRMRLTKRLVLQLQLMPHLHLQPLKTLKLPPPPPPLVRSPPPPMRLLSLRAQLQVFLASTSTDESITDEELVQLLRSRAEAKSRRDFAGADAIRSELEAKGIKIVDARASGMVGTWTDRNGRR